MKNNTIPLDTSVGSNQITHRQLHGKWLSSARVVYIISFVMVILLQTIVIASYFQGTQEFLDFSVADFAITKNDINQFVVTARDAKYPQGIEDGDILLMIDGIPVSSTDNIEDLEESIRGAFGEEIVITVQKADGTIQNLSTIRGKELVDLLAKYHLTPSLFFWFLFGTASILMISTTFISLVIYRIFKTDWLVFLVALSQLFLPFALNHFVILFEMFALSYPRYLVVLSTKIGSALLLLTIYVFPDGQIYPKRIRWLLILSVLFSSRSISFNYGVLSGLLTLQIPFLPYQVYSWLWILLLATGAFVQIQKFRKTSTALEKQQIKWAMIGFLSIAVVMLLSESFYIVNLDWWWWGENTPGFWEFILSELIKSILLSMLLLFSSIALTISIYRYRLWDADFYINRVIVYSLVTGVIAITLIVTITLLQNIVQQFNSQISPLLIAVLSSIQVATIIKPVRTWVEKWVNERFYKDRVNFVEAIVELQPEKWQFISTKDMLELLVVKIPHLIKSTRSALYLVDSKGFSLVSAFAAEKKEVRNLVVDLKDMEKLKKRKVVETPNKEPFVVLVPLTVPRGNENDLVGILALGPREKGRGYSRDHISDLADLGKSSGVAIHFLRLSENKTDS